MSIDIYINFNGNCREAVTFYAEVFEAENPKFMAFGDAPPNPDYPLPEEVKDLIMHTRLNISGSNVMFSDVFPSMPFVEGNNISLSLITNNKEEVQRTFEKLIDGGKVEMDLQETFWSTCYGSLVDKFGIHWQISLEDGHS